jgi:kanosamine 6-kinase
MERDNPLGTARSLPPLLADRRPGTRIALDIGATKLAVRAAGPDGSAGLYRRWAGDDPEADLALICSAIADVRCRLGDAVRQVGVAAAPTVDHHGRVTAWPSRPAWAGLPLGEALAEAAGAPVAIADDGMLAALAEADASGCADLAYIGLGTGVGGGLVVGGVVLRGAHGTAGEIGHLPVDPAGPECACGRRGCLQAYAGGSALATRAATLRSEPTSTRQLVAAIAAGDRWAVQVADEAALALARAVITLTEVVGPAEVHIGGGLGAALADLPQRVGAAVSGMGRAGHRLPVVRAAALGSHASLAGAMLLAQRPSALSPAPG